ncbi:hypothetical protein TP70_08315 [Staphylococcus microti]|uniref:Phage protein n=1 Tax=Staphylococcus microti TaxID=569857 RepID=A0A0D6XND8_9STAP|nr:type II toxin-antitoxin system antitoxin SocA domain-containing protein [Staphylococcus microti]KIX90329.1 hypothetical protein TP70_08315 [Staphylococcus microti]PNZ80375.1 DUF4065 domain-containing protein [Staphylococcus microti]SUM56852.1 phage protein [Staphylococcus microti]
MYEKRTQKTYAILQVLVHKYQEITGNTLIGDEMKAHNLMYYIQKTALALTGEPIIAENFEGWVHGPVLPSMRGIFEDFDEDSEYEKQLSETDIYIIENTIYSHGQYAAWALREKSHQEQAWINSRKGLLANERGQNELLLEDILEDAKDMRFYDYQYDMYLDEFDDIDEENFIHVK